MPYSMLADVAFMLLLDESTKAAPQPVDLLQLRDDWPRYGLRGSDLPPALDRLLAFGRISMNRVRNRTLVSPTDSGRLWLRSQDALVSQLRNRVRDAGIATVQSKQGRPERSTMYGRRSTDQPCGLGS